MWVEVNSKLSSLRYLEQISPLSIDFISSWISFLEGGWGGCSKFSTFQMSHTQDVSSHEINQHEIALFKRADLVGMSSVLNAAKIFSFRIELSSFCRIKISLWFVNGYHVRYISWSRWTNEGHSTLRGRMLKSLSLTLLPQYWHSLKTNKLAKLSKVYLSLVYFYEMYSFQSVIIQSVFLRNVPDLRVF